MERRLTAIMSTDARAHAQPYSIIRPFGGACVEIAHRAPLSGRDKFYISGCVWIACRAATASLGRCCDAEPPIAHCRPRNWT